MGQTKTISEVDSRQSSSSKNGFLKWIIISTKDSGAVSTHEILCVYFSLLPYLVYKNALETLFYIIKTINLQNEQMCMANFESSNVPPTQSWLNWIFKGSQHFSIRYLHIISLYMYGKTFACIKTFSQKVKFSCLQIRFLGKHCSSDAWMHQILPYWWARINVYIRQMLMKPMTNYDKFPAKKSLNTV